MTRTILRKLDGSRFASVIKYGDRWDAIARLVADEFRVRPDDVATDEGEDEFGGSIEFLTIDGERVAFLDEGDGFLPIYTYAEAAE